MRVLFADIDGVCNASGYGEDVYYDRFADCDLALDMENVKNFRQLLEDFPDLKIVWSTDWRSYDGLLWHDKWKNPRLWLNHSLG